MSAELAANLAIASVAVPMRIGASFLEVCEISVFHHASS